MKKEGLFLVLAFGILGLLTMYSNCGLHLRPQETNTQGNLPVTPGSENFTVGGQTSLPINQKITVDINGQVYDLENGNFTFPISFDANTPYEVLVVSGPGGAYQCDVENPQGVVVDQNITNVLISCTCQAANTGTGVQSDPFKIYTATDLNDIAIGQNNTE